MSTAVSRSTCPVAVKYPPSTRLTQADGSIPAKSRSPASAAGSCKSFPESHGAAKKRMAETVQLVTST